MPDLVKQRQELSLSFFIIEVNKLNSNSAFKGAVPLGEGGLGKIILKILKMNTLF